MSNRSIQRNLDVKFVTPNRYLDKNHNPSVPTSGIAEAIDQVLQPSGYSLQGIFGDIIFKKDQMDVLYVQSRDEPTGTSGIPSDTEEGPMWTMQAANPELFSGNEVRVYDCSGHIRDIGSNALKLKEFISKGEGQPEAALKVVFESSYPRINRILIVWGGIGVGKTTFLVRFLSQNPQIKRDWFDFNFIPNDKFPDMSTLVHYLREIIANRYGKKLGNYAFRKRLFHKKLEQHKAAFYVDGKLDRNRLNEKMEEFFNQDDTFLFSFLSLLARNRFNVLVFDNIDVHCHDNQMMLYELAKNIVDRVPRLRIIMTMREYTFGDLKNAYAGALDTQLSLHITPPQINEVIKTRTTFVSNLVKKVVLPWPSPISGTYGLEIKDLGKFMEYLLEPLLLPHSAEMLTCLYNRNIRAILRAILCFIESKYLQETRYVHSLLPDRDDNEYQGTKISFDDFLTITMLQSNMYYDPRLCPTYEDMIINVFELFPSQRGGNVFLPYRLLTYVVRHYRNNIALPKEDIIRDLSLALGLNQDVVEGLLHRYLEMGIIESPEGRRLEFCQTIFPTLKAWYYLHRLSKYLKYILHIRTDTCLDFKYTANHRHMDDDMVMFYLRFIDWVRRMEIAEYANVPDEFKAKYLLLLSERPISIRLFKSFVLRMDQLSYYIDPGIIKRCSKPLHAFHREILGCVRSGHLQPSVESDYFERIKDVIKKLTIK